MKLRDWLPSDGPRVQLRVTDLPEGAIQVRGWVSTAIYEPGEFAYDPIRDELHLPLSHGQKIIRQPYHH